MYNIKNKIYLIYNIIVNNKNIWNDNKNNKNLNTDCINSNDNSKNKNLSSIQKINTKIRIVYIDYELNTFYYNYAIIYDKKICSEYYFSLIKEKNLIIFSFFPRKDYNSIIIKSSIFGLSFSIHYAINFLIDIFIWKKYFSSETANFLNISTFLFRSG